MSSIAKCSGEGCHQKESCRRYNAKASEYSQVYVSPAIKDGECPLYLSESGQELINALKKLPPSED